MRVIISDPITGEGFDWEAPFTAVTRSRGLSRFSRISVTFPAAYNANIDEHGDPWILEKGTLVTVEEDNGRLVSGVVAKAPLEQDLQVEAAGVSSLAKDVPWDAPAVSWTNKDALEAWREVWEHVIHRSGMKNLRITGDTRCGVTVGKAASSEYRRVQSDIARLQPEVDRADRSLRVHTRNQNRAAQRMFRAAGRKEVGRITSGTDGPSGGGSYNAAHIVYDRETPREALSVLFYVTRDFSWVRYTTPDVVSAASDYLEQEHHLSVWKDIRRDPAGTISSLESWLEEHDEEGFPEPYELNWWSAPDLSVVLEELRETGGFDYVERTEWDGDELVHFIEVRNRVGRRLSDLKFELDQNVETRPELSRGDIRTEVQAHGAGEGETTLNAKRTLNHRRLLRTVHHISDKDWVTQQQVNRGANQELREAQKALEYTLDSIVIHDTDLAPLSLIEPGDYFELSGRYADGVTRRFPLRVMDIQRDGNAKLATLEVEPA